MSVVVVATFYPVEGKREDVVAALEVAAQSVHDEEGCELYAIHTGKDRVVLIEKYADMPALQSHGGSPALAALVTALDGLLVGEMDVQILRPSPTGGAKGTV
ncbi:putative quinol monooxygenase [Jatrophihabitans sp.]|uniref:putative quinol monooxygenase n=1 Tax=Jatrophihabitans sp. TaxID=1932789 RepID=UPI0030C735E3|nr:antibiotic biosynthesis monooxygenase [Jatrophihabitans sp.]